mmetsp:Transcript_3329/g.20770  ORF Transcript_3329/g.20770 Transcript_3329/m.20770 type:complete len:243 (-) Transcript_3329:848-1576(-)
MIISHRRSSYATRPVSQESLHRCLSRFCRVRSRPPSLQGRSIPTPTTEGIRLQWERVEHDACHEDELAASKCTLQAHESHRAVLGAITRCTELDRAPETGRKVRHTCLRRAKRYLLRHGLRYRCASVHTDAGHVRSGVAGKCNEASGRRVGWKPSHKTTPCGHSRRPCAGLCELVASRAACDRCQDGSQSVRNPCCNHCFCWIVYHGHLCNHIVLINSRKLSFNCDEKGQTLLYHTAMATGH